MKANAASAHSAQKPAAHRKAAASPIRSISHVRTGEKATVASPEPAAHTPSASPRRARNQRPIRMDAGTIDPRPQLKPATAPAR